MWVNNLWLLKILKSLNLINPCKISIFWFRLLKLDRFIPLWNNFHHSGPPLNQRIFFLRLFVTGYPSVQVASCKEYLARLYPTAFIPGWLYSAIEVINIGYFSYTRAVCKIGSASYQAAVRTTWGVENSHSLISWDRVRFIREKRDYGYDDIYDWSYGLSSRHFFDYVVAVPTVRVVEQKA